jgi:N-acetylmuramic acid 6-phosphate etherase
MTDKKHTQPQTEQADARHKGLDQWPGEQILTAIVEGQERAIAATRKAIPVIAAAAEDAAIRLRNPAGRLIYVGAGTPARLSVLDGTELTPTYGWPKVRMEFVIAGGPGALTQAVEGAEDDAAAAVAAIEKLNLTRHDVCIAVSASGTTPFTVAALRAAKARGAQTIGFASNPDAPLLKDADFGVFLDSGPEPVAGSTRMNAGTAQKAALNMFSTLTMVKLSRVYDNLMVDMQLTNAKLRKRAARMICDITGCANDEAVAALAKAGDSIKLAVLVTRGVEPQAGRDLLQAHDGNLRRALMAIKP